MYENNCHNFSLKMIKKHDLIIGKQSTIMDKCLYLEKPFLIHEYQHNIKNQFSKICDYLDSFFFCNSYDELVNSINFYLINEEVFLEKLIPVPVIIFLAISVLIWVFLEKTRHGRLMYAIGSNERAAALAGTNVFNYKILAYIISGVTASIGGILLAARLGRGDIASGNNLLLDSVAAALIGFAVLGAAKPNAFGTAIGALFVGILLQGLTMMNAPYYTQDFVKGAVLVVALIFTFALSSRVRGGSH